MTLRLNKEEQRAVEIKCRELNKQLINNDFKPITESELIHKILLESIKNTIVNKNGEVIIFS